MRCCDYAFPSEDGASTVRARLWEPGGSGAGERPPALVQIIHGMSEHIGRYEWFAGELCQAGYAVCAHDQIGHGMTAAGPDDLGHLPIDGGAGLLLADVERAYEEACELFGVRDLPHVIFGHSLGSFIARVYLTRPGTDAAGAIICGTGQQPVPLARAGNALCHILARVRGERSRSHLVHALAVGAYGRAIRDARTPFDWLSTDSAVVDAYIADPLCGREFTVGGYAAVTELAVAAQDRALANRIPRTLPMLFIAGEGDPVGDFGSGVQRAVEQYRALGMERVQETVYPGMRHEILNEPHRGRVVADILAWLQGLGL